MNKMNNVFSNEIKTKEPYDLEAERAIIGCMINYSEVIDVVIGMMSKEEFHSNVYKFIFECITELQNSFINVDLVTLRNKMIQKGMKEEELTNEFFIDLIDSSATSSNIKDYCNIVKDKYVLRKTIETCDNTRIMCYENQRESKEILEITEKALFDLSKRRGQKDFVTLKEIMPDVINQVSDAAKTKDGITGIKTGYRDIDNVTAGLQKSNFIVIAARPGEGKTSLALNLAFNMAKQHNYKVAFFSLEMSSGELAMRIAAMESRISSDKLRSGRLTDDQIDLFLNTTTTRLNITNLLIDDTSYLTIAELRSKCRKLLIEKGIDIVMLDYLQLMHAGLDEYQIDKYNNTKPKSTKNLINNRQEEVAEISRSLKGLAKELNVPIIALAQVKRTESEGKTRRKPQLSDLRESGAIEQDADIVMFINKEKNEELMDESFDNDRTEIIFAKHRNGRTGSVFLRFDKATTKFHNYSAEKIPNGFDKKVSE